MRPVIRTDTCRWTLYEYGSRAGFWRIHNEFCKRGLPLTVFGVAMALARHPDIVDAIKAADYDVVSHGWRWIHYQSMDINQNASTCTRRCMS